MFSHVKMKKKPVFMIIPMIDIIFFLLVFFMMNSLQTVAQHEQEKMYVVDLDASELTDSGSGHAGGGGGGGSAESLFPDKLSETDVAQRTAAVEAQSSALTPPEQAAQAQSLLADVAEKAAAPAAPAAQAPSPAGPAGTGSAPFDSDGFWSAVNANKSYPPMAIKRGLTGTVTVTVVLDSSGNCVSVSADSSGLLAKAAVNAVYAACPYPTPWMSIS